MPTILSKLPFSTLTEDLRDLEGNLVVFGHQTVKVKAYQIVVWVGISPGGGPLHDRAQPIPAILDTGHSGYFSIQANHLHQWAGLHPRSLRPMPSVVINKIAVPRLAATIYLQPNSPGSRSLHRAKPAFRLSGDVGIAVYPPGGQDPEGRDYPRDYPRLPVLGMRGLTENRLRLSIDFGKLHVFLRPASRFSW